ncbi:cupin domain protein [mine drainage metagenome]|uniref:Cupin domain protein n=1 Tax=mine drainage metagenome TaxID=410659 RepID=A0A1J5RVH0_9ZZZZ
MNTTITSSPAAGTPGDAGASATKNKGAVKAGDGAYIFALTKMAGMDAGIGYSTAFGPVIEGERMQVGLITKRRGTGAKPHTHPNEQWNYIVQGTLRVRIADQPEQLCGPGTLLYFPANTVHSTVATTDDDVVFFTVKDMSHGIHGKAVDGTADGGYFEAGFETK